MREFASHHPAFRIFLVGGAVRDRLLGRSTRDLDFAVSAGEQDLARQLEGRGFGRAVLISADASPFPVWRLSRSAFTIDIARFEGGDTIESDLGRRDFTVNSIARDVLSGRIVDPRGGRADLARKRIRMVSPRNLDEDPIRVLRAYRLAATLGFAIERRTRTALRLRSSSLRGEAKERVHAEVVRLFGAPHAARAIRRAESDGVLSACLGIPAPKRGGKALLLARFDGLRRPEELRLVFRLGVLLFRYGIAGRALSDLLAGRGFSRHETAEVGRCVGFLESAFSSAPPERVLFGVREQWVVLKTLLRLTAVRREEISRAGFLLSAARRCRFDPAPVDGRDIALWLGAPPGKELGAALERARFLYFTRRVRSRADLENSVRTFDRSGGVG